MKCKIIIGLSAILYFTGCYNREQTPRLSEAEKLMQNNPDSALAILQKLKPEGNRLNRPDMHCSIPKLWKKNKWKLLTIHWSARLGNIINITPKIYVTSVKLYIIGEELNYAQVINQGALRLFLKIEKKLTDTDESYYKGLLYRQIGEVYYKQMNYSRAYHYFHEARNNFRQSGDIQERQRQSLTWQPLLFTQKI